MPEENSTPKSSEPQGISEIPELGDVREDTRVEGEPEFPRIVWDLPGREDPQTMAEAIEILHETAAVCVEQQRSIRWLRGEIHRLRQHGGPEADTEAARKIKLEVVKTLEEMLPQARRAAKRGKPALLRLIVRTIRTKL